MSSDTTDALRTKLVRAALEWEHQFGVAPRIVSAISEYDAARLLGGSDADYASAMRGVTAVQKGFDFVLGGIRYQVKSNRPSGKPGSRVTIESVGGEPFSLEAIYTIATNDFTAAGGDTYYAFRYPNATSGYKTGVALEDALVRYIAEVLGGVVGGQYAEPQGRITVK